MTVDETFEFQTYPDTRQVVCDECPKVWRYGCVECAEDFADWHRTEFGHQVAVIPPHREYTRPRLRRRNWWET